MERKLRILCLHGMSQNATIFRKKTAVIRKKLDKIADLVYVTAPHLSLHPDHTSEILREAAADPTAPEDLKPFGWWLPSDGDEFDGLKESMAMLKKVMIEQGPFDGVFGFSQGAALASMLTAMLDDRTLAPEFIDNDFVHPRFRFSLVSASFIPESKSLACRLFLRDAKITTPSLHMIGEKDSLIVPERMEKLAAAFDKPTFLHHAGGHVVPSNAPARNAILEFVSRFVQ
ncbi:serine hydrolase FSH [Gongronella butleri]|nr:serine hydrolase FSH [Gongronella butleri]